MSVHTVEWEGKKLQYYFIRKEVKNINLTINEKEEIIVSAGKKVPFSVIDSFVKSKGKWITVHLEKVKNRKQQLPNKDIDTGKTVYYKGGAYQVCVVQKEKNEIVVKEETKEIIIFTKYKNTMEKVRQQYKMWLKQNAIVFFGEILEEIYPLVSSYGIQKPVFTVRDMKTRWGSCSVYKGTIRLNLQLMKTPKSCIEQVILHELVHFKYIAHDKAFYDEMEKLIPDYKQRKKELEQKWKDGI